MFTISDEAVKQISVSAEQSDSTGMALRIAARRNSDGGLEYAMGFDDKKESDTIYHCNGVDVVVANDCSDLLEGATLDYVELNPGKPEFIFRNPNDPAHKMQ